MRHHYTTDLDVRDHTIENIENGLYPYEDWPRYWLDSYDTVLKEFQETIMTEKVKLVKTCRSCPEQYDAYIDGQRLGYLRLRNGNFSVEYCGDTVFSGRPRGDGMFEHEERNSWLNKACYALLQAHNKKEEELQELLFEIEEEEFDE